MLDMSPHDHHANLFVPCLRMCRCSQIGMRYQE